MIVRQITPHTYRDYNGDISCLEHAPHDLLELFAEAPNQDEYIVDEHSGYVRINESDISIIVGNDRKGTGKFMTVYIPTCEDCERLYRK